MLPARPAPPPARGLSPPAVNNRRQQQQKFRPPTRKLIGSPGPRGSDGKRIRRAGGGSGAGTGRSGTRLGRGAWAPSAARGCGGGSDCRDHRGRQGRERERERASGAGALPFTPVGRSRGRGSHSRSVGCGVRTPRGAGSWVRPGKFGGRFPAVRRGAARWLPPGREVPALRGRLPPAVLLCRRPAPGVPRVSPCRGSAAGEPEATADLCAGPALGGAGGVWPCDPRAGRSLLLPRPAGRGLPGGERRRPWKQPGRGACPAPALGWGRGVGTRVWAGSVHCG